MDKLRKTLVLLCVIGTIAAATPFLMTSPDLCFTAGSVTYRLSPNERFPDYRVAIDNEALYPDMRVRLVDHVEDADFALTDDTGTMAGTGCAAATQVKTIRIVPTGAPADITIAVSRREARSDLALYVHSARVSHLDAAALFALVRQAPEPVSKHVASIR